MTRVVAIGCGGLKCAHGGGIVAAQAREDDCACGVAPQTQKSAHISVLDDRINSGVIAGLDPAIHRFNQTPPNGWVPGSSPGMTRRELGFTVT
jgi:hypothetical protein